MALNLGWFFGEKQVLVNFLAPGMKKIEDFFGSETLCTCMLAFWKLPIQCGINVKTVNFFQYSLFLPELILSLSLVEIWGIFNYISYEICENKPKI